MKPHPYCRFTSLLLLLLLQVLEEQSITSNEVTVSGEKIQFYLTRYM